MAKKGYWIVFYRSASDPTVQAEYGKVARPAIEAAGGRTLAAGKPAKTFESGANERVVVIEFDSVEKAIAAYQSDAYKAALKVFNNAAQRDIRIVESL
ncbi:MAG TPA: DUF1330 domain-containing protein [Terriglobales bacterium]|jgi:uncharacterized protein (DUF1330 family)|nr:DUF1330 domain-containing protein [Terriglobales bacterium]